MLRRSLQQLARQHRALLAPSAPAEAWLLWRQALVTAPRFCPPTARDFAKAVKSKGGRRGEEEAEERPAAGAPPPFSLERVRRFGDADAQAQLGLTRQRSKFEAAAEALRRELGKLRTGRANPGLLEHVSVVAYGTPTPLGQLGALTARDATTLVVTLYDSDLAAAAEAAIRASPLGLVPRQEGGMVVVPVPAPSAESRAAVAKLAAAAGEAAKASGRRVRAEANEELRRAEAGSSKDEVKRREREVQGLADAFGKEAAALCAEKERELRSV